MLRVVKNVSWKQRIRNEVLYGKIPKVTTTIAAQRVTFSRHCWRSKDELAHHYYYGNQHMAKELGAYQDEHSLINWLMTLNYRKKILQMR